MVFVDVEVCHVEVDVFFCLKLRHLMLAMLEEVDYPACKAIRVMALEIWVCARASSRLCR